MLHLEPNISGMFESIEVGILSQQPDVDFGIHHLIGTGNPMVRTSQMNSILGVCSMLPFVLVMGVEELIWLSSSG